MTYLDQSVTYQCSRAQCAPPPFLPTDPIVYLFMRICPLPDTLWEKGGLLVGLFMMTTSRLLSCHMYDKCGYIFVGHLV